MELAEPDESALRLALVNLLSFELVPEEPTDDDTAAVGLAHAMKRNEPDRPGRR